MDASTQAMKADTDVKTGAKAETEGLTTLTEAMKELKELEATREDTTRTVTQVTQTRETHEVSGVEVEATRDRHRHE